MAVLAGQDAGPAGRADRVDAEAGVQPHALAGDAVEIRRLVDPAAVGADGVCRMVVGHDEQDVRPRGCGGGEGGPCRGKHRKLKPGRRKVRRSRSFLMHIDIPLFVPNPDLSTWGHRVLMAGGGFPKAGTPLKFVSSREQYNENRGTWSVGRHHARQGIPASVGVASGRAGTMHSLWPPRRPPPSRHFCQKNLSTTPHRSSYAKTACSLSLVRRAYNSPCGLYVSPSAALIPSW